MTHENEPEITINNVNYSLLGKTMEYSANESSDFKYKYEKYRRYVIEQSDALAKCSLTCSQEQIFPIFDKIFARGTKANTYQGNFVDTLVTFMYSLCTSGNPKYLEEYVKKCSDTPTPEKIRRNLATALFVCRVLARNKNINMLFNNLFEKIELKDIKSGAWGVITKPHAENIFLLQKLKAEIKDSNYSGLKPLNKFLHQHNDFKFTMEMVDYFKTITPSVLVAPKVSISEKIFSANPFSLRAKTAKNTVTPTKQPDNYLLSMPDFLKLIVNANFNLEQLNVPQLFVSRPDVLLEACKTCLDFLKSRDANSESTENDVNANNMLNGCFKALSAGDTEEHKKHTNEFYDLYFKRNTPSTPPTDVLDAYRQANSSAKKIMPR